ncbi:SpaH/EbpB family LPXTG-anchored major pilin [Arcanobacterium haemolyticum]
MNLKKTKLGRMGALVTALTLASVGAATAASADDTKGFDLPDKNRTVSLTIEKYIAPEASGRDHGAGLKGVTFEIQKLGVKDGDDECQPVDLTTVHGWFLASNVLANPAQLETCKLSSPIPAITGTDGKVKVSKDLEKTLYEVTETDSGSNPVVSKVEPFKVALPMPNGKNSWTYDVVAKPKNKLADDGALKIEKKVLEADKVAEATVTWQVTATLPELAFPYKKVEVTDTPDRNYSGLAITSAKYGEDALATDDYTFEGGVFKLTNAGLAKVKEGGKNLVITLTTKVTDGKFGAFENKATLSAYGNPLETTASTVWGKLNITKIDDNRAPLKDAEFTIYAGKCSDLGANPQVIASVTTNDKGEASKTLLVNKGDAASADYCVKETKAPAGYLLDNSGFDINFSASELNVDIEHQNVKVTGPNLPLTGAQGTALLTGVGLLLLAAGAGTVYFVRRRDV